MTPNTSWTDDQKRLIFNTVAKDLEKPDQALFEAVCLSSGLDPLRKEIYAVVRGGKMAVQTGIDGYLKLANQTKELNGMEVLFFDEDGNESEVWLKKTPPTACLVRVYRKGAQFPFTASCRFDAYSQSNHMWRKFPETMLAKATTTLALRRGFADVISGIASSDELAQAGLAADEALLQGTPAPKPGTPTKRPATAKKAPAAEAVKEFKGSSPKAKAAPDTAEAAAKSLAAGTAGAVVEVPVEEKPSTPGQNDLTAVGLELGFTSHAIDGILGLIKGDFVKGIATMKSKNSAEIEKLNSKFAPAETVDQNW